MAMGAGRDARADRASRTMKGSLPVGKGALAVAVIVTLVIGVIGGTTAGYLLGKSQAAPGPTTPTDGADVTFRLQAKQVPGFTGIGGDIDGEVNPDLRVNVGDRVTIVIVGGEINTHDLFVEAFTARTDYVTAPGQEASVTFIADRASDGVYYCTVPGHRLTMEGRFIVAGDGGDGGLPPPGPAKNISPFHRIARNATAVPPPVNRSTPADVHLYLEAVEVTSWIEPGTTFDYWTYNGTVPGPFYRVRVNDTVTVHFGNHEDNGVNHSVDFHAVTGPGGGAAYASAAPGGWGNFTFKALNPGLFIYHCATPHIPSHISQGMYGLILVEPEGGLAPVDREFYVVQGDIYTLWPAGTEGHQIFDTSKLLDEEPTYVVFNGMWQALTGEHALRANVGETIRIYFGVGGPNLISSFHVIGEIFDRVYLMGDVLSAPQQSVQTTLIPPGGAAIVEFAVEVAGTYILVDHALVRTIDKGSLGLLIVEGTSVPGVYEGTP